MEIPELVTKAIDLGRTGYEAYGKTTDFKNYQGLPMPDWEELPEQIRSAWVSAAIAVAKKVAEY